MRAKRSKKYRKIMSMYQQAFSFREPYQVLLDAAFIRTCHSFHMPLQKYLENTLHGQCKIFVTQCTLAKIMSEHEKAGGRPRSRPDFLPIPTELPLRYCKHKNKDGEEIGVVPEAQCLIDLLAGQPHGNELAKNKQHYILATADPPEEEQRKKRFIDIRERARQIPGVPVVYVKRSVMILEEMSGASEGIKRVQEKEKLQHGLVGDRKRKRGEEDEDEEDDMLKSLQHNDGSNNHTRRGMQKARGPNPLSVQKKKVKVVQPGQNRTSQAQNDAKPKARRRRKHGTGNKDAGNDNELKEAELANGTASSLDVDSL